MYLIFALVALCVLALPLGVAAFVVGGHLRYRAVPEANHSFHGVALLRYWWREISAILQASLWAMLRRRGEIGEGVGRPVICVHGFMGDASNLWGIRRALEDDGRRTIAVDLGTPLKELHQYVPPLQRAIEEAIASSPDGTFDVVAHSMGGLILWLASLDTDLKPHVRRIVTLGSPFQGTRGAPKSMGKETGQMSYQSDFIRDLPPVDQALTSRWTSFAAAQDYIVYPESSSNLKGSEHIVLTDTGHTGLLTHPHCLRAVVDALAEECERS